MITALAWSPTRPVLAVAGYSGLVQLWRVDGAPRLARSLTGLYAVPGAPEAIQALTFSPDGQLLAASDSSRTDTQGIMGAVLTAKRRSFRDAGDLASEQRQTSSAEGSRDRPRSLRRPRVLPRREAAGRKPPRRQRPGPRPRDRSGPADASSVRRRRDGLARFRTQRDPRDRHPGRDRPAVEPDQRPSGRGSGGRGCRPGHQHRVRPHWPAVRDHRRSGRNGQAVVQLNASSKKAPRSTPSRAPLPPPRSSPAARSLLVVDDHGNGFTWPTSLAAWEQRACTVAGRNLTRAEWTRYLPGHPYTRVCP